MHPFSDGVGLSVLGTPSLASQIVSDSKLSDTQLEVPSSLVLFCVLAQEREHELTPWLRKRSAEQSTT
jgi:hypothetical protein